MPGFKRALKVSVWFLRRELPLHRDIPEAGGDMTTLTVLAKLAAVVIGPPVAVDALAGELAGITGPGMTGRACKALVPASQFEVGRRIVIEFPYFPVAGVVALAASGWFSERSAMLLVLVAAGASQALR